MKYNPFLHSHLEKATLKLVNTLICNTKGAGRKSAERFLGEIERLFYTRPDRLYLAGSAGGEEMNFTTLLEMINASEAP